MWNKDFIIVFVIVCCAVGKPVKADIRSDKGVAVGLLVVNDWDLLQPLVMRSSDFEAVRSRLGGFGEICKSASTAALNFSENSPLGGVEMQLIGRMKCALNMYLVQGAGVNELMFAASAKKGLTESRLLITIETGR